MREPRPLIVSWLRHDLHAAAVCWALRKAGCTPQWIEGWADASLPPVSLHCDGDSLAAQGGFGEEGFTSVWFRRPRDPHDFPGTHEADYPFLRNEWGRFSRNLQALAPRCSSTLWANEPAATFAAEDKMLQLEAARATGLRFPATLMSNDPERIRAFARHHGRIIYKPFQTHTWQDAGGRMYSTYARILDPGMLEADAPLRQCPGIFQRLVEKQYDVRVFIVGEHQFAVRLDGPGEADHIDWRVGSLSDSVSMQPLELPGDISRRLRDLMARLGLVTGSVDLAVDAAGECHFLEINQAGQFLFLEQALPELPLTRAMGALLVQARGDFDLQAFPAVGYHDYLESDEHLAWWERVSPDIKGPKGEIPGVSVEHAPA